MKARVLVAIRWGVIPAVVACASKPRMTVDPATCEETGGALVEWCGDVEAYCDDGVYTDPPPRVELYGGTVRDRRCGDRTMVCACGEGRVWDLALGCVPLTACTLDPLCGATGGHTVRLSESGLSQIPICDAGESGAITAQDAETTACRCPDGMVFDLEEGCSAKVCERE